MSATLDADKDENSSEDDPTPEQDSVEDAGGEAPEVDQTPPVPDAPDTEQVEKGSVAQTINDMDREEVIFDANLMNADAAMALDDVLDVQDEAATVADVEEAPQALEAADTLDAAETPDAAQVQAEAAEAAGKEAEEAEEAEAPEANDLLLSRGIQLLQRDEAPPQAVVFQDHAKKHATNSLTMLYLFFVVCLMLAALFATKSGRTRVLEFYRKVSQWVWCPLCGAIQRGCEWLCSKCAQILPRKLSNKISMKWNDFSDQVTKQHRKLVGSGDGTQLRKKSVTSDVEADPLDGTDNTKNGLLSVSNIGIDMGSISNSDDGGGGGGGSGAAGVGGGGAGTATSGKGAQQRRAGSKLKKYKNEIAMDKERQTLIATSNPSDGAATKDLFTPELKDGVSYILLPSMVRTIHSWLPLRLNWLDWRRLYTSSEDGTSMLTFYDKVSNDGPTILIVKDENGYIFGVFISQAWNHSHRGTHRNGSHLNQHHSNSFDSLSNSHDSFEHGSDAMNTMKFFGGSDTFVFQIYPNSQKYSWTKSNRFFVFCEKDGITIGGGDHAALRLQRNLSCGTSQHSDTYNNPVLSKNEDFKCNCVEVWGFDEYK